MGGGGKQKDHRLEGDGLAFSFRQRNPARVNYKTEIWQLNGLLSKVVF
jgi:hypothetical protein